MAATDTTALRSELERFADGVPKGEEAAALEAFRVLKAELNAGRVRAAERGPDGRWRANGWVKAGILLGFRLGRVGPAATGGPEGGAEGGGNCCTTVAPARGGGSERSRNANGC